jgi:hypothetical protein
MLEEAAGVLDQLAAQPVRPPLLRHLVPQRAEVVRADVADQSRLAEVAYHQDAHLLVVGPGPGRQFAGVHQGLLGLQESVGRFLDGDALGVRPGRAASMPCALLFQVFRQRAVRVVPRAEAVPFAPDLLGPTAGGVGEEGEFWARPGGLAGSRWRGRMICGPGDCSLIRVSLWPRVGRLRRPGQ